MLSTLILNSKSGLALMCGWIIGAAMFQMAVYPQSQSAPLVVNNAARVEGGSAGSGADLAVLMRVERYDYYGDIEEPEAQVLDITDAEVQETLHGAYDLALEIQEMSQSIRLERSPDVVQLCRVSVQECALRSLPTR